MKKLKLNLQQFPGAEVLTRSQLKNVLGGHATNTTGHACYGSQTTCTYQESGTGEVTGTCSTNSTGHCICSNGTSSVPLDTCVKTA